MNTNEEKARLARWYIEDGALVRHGEAICEIETSEANVDVSAPHDGVLRQLAAIGDIIRTGADVARIDPVP
jgi:pyruvate/2-oxoglutarate dehydrogenase complex dihydrolipoamide acyltransferase (E2) component